MKKILKMVAALVLALFILDVFCFWYYNPPAYEWDESRATDNIREPNAVTSRATEGIAWSRMDANGYNNPDVPGGDGVFVLMMGSSHTEGMNVMQDETVSSRLQARLKERGMEGCVYNIGISAHTLVRNAVNLDRALERFEPSGYVVLETQHIKFHRDSIRQAMDESFERFGPTETIFPEWISDRPLMRALYNQWQSLTSGAGEEPEADSDLVVTDEMLAAYQSALTELLVRMRETAQAHEVQMIIYYHPHLLLQEDGTAITDSDAGCLEAFRAACAAAEVPFLDMTETFLAAYAEESILPHGFSNTAPGAGHLNPDGTGMIADELCEMILEMEADA